ncbi:hypothetical protein Ciccas_005122 [Cichlidogyrus casuarinus]|uniref:Uncharacterized protein n=1 Tax=Cichlidogyrus casuarinus TaxID=1844966 RepID=A0ABD2Q9Z3_9PLAT
MSTLVDTSSDFALFVASCKRYFEVVLHKPLESNFPNLPDDFSFTNTDICVISPQKLETFGESDSMFLFIGKKANLG